MYSAHVSYIWGFLRYPLPNGEHVYFKGFEESSAGLTLLNDTWAGFQTLSKG